MSITSSALISSTSVHPDALYALLKRGAPLLTKANQTLPRTIALGARNGKNGTPIGADNGNFKFKQVVMHAKENRLVSHAIIAATGPVPKTRTKASMTKYRVRDMDVQPSTFSEWFLIGQDALNFSPAEQLSLGVGSTYERLSSDRQLNFILACHIETLKAAGYMPGTYYGIINYGLPNEEFENGQLTDQAADALSRIDEHTFEIERQVQGESSEKYILNGAEVMAFPQTSGTFVALNYTLNGELCPSDIEEERFIDLGGGHTQEYRVKRVLNNLNEIELVATGGRLGVGKGTISIARELTTGLREAFSNINVSDILSQVALVKGTYIVNGRPTPLDTLIDASILSRSVDSLLSDTLGILQQEGASVTFTGGGLSLPLIYEQLLKRTEMRKEGIHILEPELARVISSYGLYLQAVMDSSKRNLM